QLAAVEVVVGEDLLAFVEAEPALLAEDGRDAVAGPVRATGLAWGGVAELVADAELHGDTRRVSASSSSPPSAGRSRGAGDRHARTRSQTFDDAFFRSSFHSHFSGRTACSSRLRITSGSSDSGFVPVSR